MTEVGNVYGQALYDLASAEKLDGEILSQLTVLEASFQNTPEFLRLLHAPSLSKQERCQILDDSFRGKIHPYVLNFLKILAEKGYFRHFSPCVRTYRKSYNIDHNILPVTAVTAVALTQEQAGKLQSKLSALTGKTVELQEKLDPAVLGGVRLDYDGKRLDDTVLHRLDTLRSLLKNTVL